MCGSRWPRAISRSSKRTSPPPVSPICGSPSHPLTGPAGTWRFVKENVSGYRRARRFVRLTKVSLVVGLGGYASLPMAWAATSSGIPLVLLEQNAFPGRVTRWFAPRAALICAAFRRSAAASESGGPVRVTGNPIRGGFLSAAEEIERPASPDRQLLILGGSGGSRTLNEQVPRALYKIASRADRLANRSSNRPSRLRSDHGALSQARCRGDRCAVYRANAAGAAAHRFGDLSSGRHDAWPNWRRQACRRSCCRGRKPRTIISERTRMYLQQPARLTCWTVAM